MLFQEFHGTQVPTYTVKICGASGAGPSSTCSAALTNPTLADGINEFTASGDGIDLNAHTDYVIFVDTPNRLVAATAKWAFVTTDSNTRGRRRRGELEHCGRFYFYP